MDGWINGSNWPVFRFFRWPWFLWRFPIHWHLNTLRCRTIRCGRTWILLRRFLRFRLRFLLRCLRRRHWHRTNLRLLRCSRPNCRRVPRDGSGSRRLATPPTPACSYSNERPTPPTTPGRRHRRDPSANAPMDRPWVRRRRLRCLAT